MKNDENSKIISKTTKAFQREELIDYSVELNKIQCHILENGLNEVKSTFYICECDPERANPICKECFTKCHFNGSQFPHKEIQCKEMEAICICGYKCHRPLNESEKHDKQYKSNCTFGELGTIPELNFNYQDNERSNMNICLMCYNICFMADEKLVKHSIESLKSFKCSCSNHNHSDLRIIFRKLRFLAKGNNFIKIYNFEGMTFLHFINILTTSKSSFQNLFHSFVDRILETYQNMQSLGYNFEEHNTLNDLHLTSQVLLVFSQKCKNEYKVINKINKVSLINDNEESDLEEDMVTEQNNKDLTLGVKGGKLDAIKIKCQPLCYFNDIIKNILNEKIYYKIMERKFDSKCRNIWQLKYYLTGIFHKFYVEKDFASCPNIKIYDIVLLSPLQRMLMISSIETEKKVSQYVNNLNDNFLNNTLNAIEAVICTQEKSISVLLILANLYKICKKFAKFSLFNHEQLSKLCSLNDSVIGSFEEEKQDAEKDFLKLKVISPMLKILLFLSYYYNDQLIISALKGEKDADKLKFFHGQTEINKNINSNAILITSFLQRFNDSVVEKEKEKEINNKKYKKNKIKDDDDALDKDQDMFHHIERNYLKCLKHTIRNCKILFHLSLCPDEEYNSTIVRLIDNDQKIIFDYYKGNLSIKEKEFLQRVKYFTEQLEDNYSFYYQSFVSQQSEEKFTQKFEDIITEFNKNFVPITYLDNAKKNLEEEDSQLLKKDHAGSDLTDKKDDFSERERERFNTDSAQESNLRNTIVNANNKYLIIKSFFLQSVVKFIHVMYFSYYSRKNTREKFYIKPQIFKIIMEILYNFSNGCPENSFFLLQSVFITNFELLNDDQLLQSLSLIINALENISKSKRDLPYESNLIHLIKVALLKSNKIEILDEILKILRILSSSINCLNFNNVQIKIMRLCKIIFNYHTIIKNYFTLMTSSKDDQLSCFQGGIEKTIKKFMCVLNNVSDQKTIIKEKEFFDMIVTKEQLKKILYVKNLNISLRTELITFYRKCFLETLLEKKDINYFTSILINDYVPEKNDELIDNPRYNKFFEFLVKSGDYSGELVLEKDANTIKFELLNFQEVLTITTDRVKTYKYIESVIKCTIVYFAKFSSLIFESSGFNCLSMYEIIYYFLLLKRYIYSRSEVFKQISTDKNKVLFKRKLMARQNYKIDLINPDDIGHEEQQKRGKKDFSKRYLVKTKKKIVNPKNDWELVEYDLTKLSDENYEFLNYAKIKKTFMRHINEFIKFPKVKGIKEVFEKNNKIDDEKVEKYTEYLKSIGRMKNTFDKDCLSIIVSYINLKFDLEKSSFIKVLDETNAHHNTTYRMILCRSIPFFYSAYNKKYKSQVIWFLLKLLQYDTTGVQEAFIEMESQNKLEKPVFDFNELVEDFTNNIMTVILREINYNGYENRNEYLNAVLDIKVMKYFCEEHNVYFQSFFFNNSETSPKDVIVRYKNRLKVRKQKKKDEPEDIITNSPRLNKKKSYSVFPIGNLPSDEYREIESSLVYSKKASLFEYLLRVIGKIILLSNWTNNKTDCLDDYFYDIYFVILEFLIETIQGTSRENLSKIFITEKKGKSLFQRFLSEINHILLDDSSNAPLNYVLRKDMMEFIMAFLEESATPPNSIVEISSVIIPSSILDSIIATMNKLYNEEIEEDEENKEKENKENNNSNNNKNKEKNDKNNENNKNDNSNNNKKPSLLNEDSEKDKTDNYYFKKTFKFTPKMKDYFGIVYFGSPDFGENEKFALANRMYQYFKMLGQGIGYKNQYVCEFYNKLEMFSNEQVIRAYSNKNFKLINKETNAPITEAKFNDQYLCVSFFESITRTVFVQKENEGIVSVIFTINPIVPLLSHISKEDFIDTVDRNDRYTKLMSLLDRCDNFFSEIKYRQQTGNGNFIKRMINDINFYILEAIAFFITLSINIIMLAVLDGEGDVLYGDEKINYLLKDFGYVNVIYNILCVIFWLIAKYQLLFMTECQKMEKMYELKNQDGDKEEKEIILSLTDKLMAAYIVLIQKKKLLVFLWNIILSSIAAFTEVYFIYIIQLFIIFNLSVTLRNLITSLGLRGGQLLSVFYFSVIVNLCLASIAFYKFEEDFTKAIDSKMPHNYPEGFDFLNDLIGGVYSEPSHIESECGTFAYCLATHLDYGMRFDGGIADRMSRRSYNYNQNFYLARFFYEMIYFWSQTVMLQGMVFSIVIEAFSELRNKEIAIEKDKKEICFVCGVDKTSCEKNGQKFEDHVNKEHNLWTYVDFILGLKFIDIQETNAINSYVMEKIERKELVWFPAHKVTDDSKNDNKD